MRCNSGRFRNVLRDVKTHRNIIGETRVDKLVHVQISLYHNVYFLQIQPVKQCIVVADPNRKDRWWSVNCIY